MSDFFSKYQKDGIKAIKSIDAEELKKAAQLLKRAQEIYVGGNGGSAAIANHLQCDIQKGCRPKSYFKVHSLSSNSSLITAIANDLGYDQTLKHQLESHLIYVNDVVILISSSGTSPNVVAAAEYVKHQTHCKLIGFTGFTGGRLRELADVKIHVDSHSYGNVEDAHQYAMHAIANYLVNET